MSDPIYDEDMTFHRDTTQPQEQNVDTTQENPAVSKLREAFDTARNAIIEGSELAKVVGELRSTVSMLQSELQSLQRDLEYVRNRNRELDEQVTAVRAARDEAIANANQQQERAVRAEAALEKATLENESQNRRLSEMYDRIDALKRERDDAELKAMDLEDRLKAAQAKLTTIEALFVGQTTGATQEKPKPHWEDQPRAETGEFQSFDRGSQSESSGF
jgi:chromosome segregation ATPase